MKKLFKQTMPLVLILIGLAFTSCNSKNKSEEQEAQQTEAEQQGILLRYNPQIGEPITYTTTIEQSLNFFGQQSTTNMNMIMVTTATEKADTLITAISRLEEMVFSSDMMGQHVSFDSKHMEDADPALASTFKDIIGKEFEIVSDIYGNVVSMPEDFPNNDQGFAAIFPKERIQEGSEWTVENENVINDMEMQTVMTYTVKEITKDRTKIELNGTVKSDMAEGEMTGDMEIDNQLGIPKICKINMPLTISGIPINQTITIATE